VPSIDGVGTKAISTPMQANAEARIAAIANKIRRT
jgi:hypothetical protein